MILYLFDRLMCKGAVHEVIEYLMTALEEKDIFTYGHSTRVAEMASDLAKHLGIRGSMLEDIHLAAHVHDIGKMSISKNILNKKSKLLPHEWAQIQMHPEIGYKIFIKSKGMQRIAEIVLYHRERWDGSGYPKGIAKDKIPIGSRIIAVTDAIDAMLSLRPYRNAMSWEDCMDELRLNTGVQFDPVIIQAVEKLCLDWKSKWYMQ